METVTRKTVDMLTSDSVSVLTQKFIELDGEQTQVGENHRCAYTNSARGRILLAESEPAEVVSAVMAMWGDTPTVEEPEYPVEE